MNIVISQCRVCGNKNLADLLTLGNQVFTGFFPSTKEEHVPSAPLSLVKCYGGENDNHCGLVQLKHSYDLNQLYGDNYGYRSGLNKSMVGHLNDKVNNIIKIVKLENGDAIIDIGSNDATSLKAYPQGDYNLIGVDPTAEKFREFYPTHIKIIPKFFSLKNVVDHLNGRKAKIVTSFSMFYDLEKPLEFMQDIYNILDDEGVWCFEQSYLASMLKMNSFDTICHEHMEYYHLEPILWMCQQVGFKIIDLSFNEINGGSISITVCKKHSSYVSPDRVIKEVLEQERKLKLNTLQPYTAFAQRILQIKEEIIEFFYKTKSRGEIVYGLGASTKGNVLLQYCNLDAQFLPAIGEVNEDKVGKFTPGSLIPIINQDDVLKANPAHLLVLPWHFKEFFKKSKELMNFSLVYPLPTLTINS